MEASPPQIEGPEPKEPMNDAQRGSLLNQRVAEWTQGGWRVESQTEFSATLVNGKRPNHILHLLLTIITAGLWAIVWLILALTSKVKRRTIHVDPYGQIIG